MIQVPLFVEQGQRIRVDTRSGEYVARAPEMRRSEQRRAAVVALYQHDLTGRPLAETLGPNASLFARALAHAAADRARGARRGRSTATRTAGRWQRIQPLERSIMRVALIEMLHPDAAPARAADPAGGGDRGGGREREDVLRRGRARRSSTGCWRAVLREVRENAQHADDAA